MSEQEFNEELEETFGGQQAERKKRKIRPLGKMIARYYMSNGWIDPEEEDEFLDSFEDENKPVFVRKIDGIISAVLNSLIGALIAPLLVKMSQKVSQSLDYQNEEEAIKAEYKRNLLKSMLDN